MEEYLWISKLAHHPVFVYHAHPTLERLARLYNVKVTVAGPDDASTGPYVQAVYDGIKRRVSGIMVVGWGDDEMASAIDRAQDMGIPVVTVDSDVPNSRRLAHTGTDWYGMGSAMAERLAVLVGERGKVLMMGMFGLPNIMSGFRGFQDQIATCKNIELLGPVNDLDSGYDKARTVVADYLAVHDDLAGIAGFDANSGPGASQAIEEAGKAGVVRLVCVDPDGDHHDYIRRGTIDAAFAQKRETFTYRAFLMLYMYHHGSPEVGHQPGLINIPGNIETGYVLVTRENLSTYHAELSLEQVFESHELSQRLALLTSMVEHSIELVIATDSNGRIVYANPSVMHELGFEESKLLQSNFESIFEITARQRAEIGMSVAEGGSYRLETIAQRHDGTTFPVQVSVSPLNSYSPVRGMVVTATDVSERQHARHTIERKTNQQQKLIEIARHLAESLDLNEVMARIGKGARDILEATGCTIYLLESDGRRLRPVISLEGQYEDEIMSVMLDIDTSFTGQAVKARRSLIFNDAAYDASGYHIPGTPEYDEEHIIAAPFIVDGKVLGAMCLTRTDLRFEEDDRILAETFAAYASTALKNSQIYNQLQAEVRERKRAQEELAQSEEKYRNMVELAPDGILIIGLDGIVTSCNSAFLTLTGYSNQEIIGLPFKLLPVFERKDTRRYEKILNNAIKKSGRHSKPYEIQWINKTGVLLTGEILVSLLRKNENVTGYLVIIHDTSEKKQAEQALQESQHRYRTISELTSDYAYSFRVQPDHSLVCEWITGALSRITGYAVDDLMAHGIWESLVYPEDRPVLRLHLERLLSGKESTVEYRIITTGDQIRWVLDYARPLHENGRNRVAFIYGAVQDITQRKQHEREQDAIVSVTTALRIAQTRAEMPPVILQQAIALLEADGAEMAIRDPATGESVIEHAVGVASANLGQRLSPGKGVVGFVIESGEPYLSNDMTVDSLVVPVQGMDPPRAMAAIPMITEEQTIGALVVGRDTPFFEADLRVLAAVGNIAANAIQRATLYEETHRRLMRLNALHNIDKAMTANIDLNATLNVILEQIASQLGIDAASVLIYEAPMHELVYAVGRGFHVKLPSQKALRVGKGLAGRVAIERRMIHIPDLLANGRSFDQMPAAFHDEGFVAYLGMPLIAKGDLKGVLEIFHRKPLDPDREWISFLDTLARQAAIAIDNASLFDGLQRTNLELTLSYDTTLEGWAKALEMRDHPTEGHSRRVTERTLHLARAMGMSTEELVHVRRGAMLHDIGKMSTPDHILHKAGPLTEEEWEIMRVHPITAFNLLSTIPFLRQAIDIPYCHHEKWDGTGYPRGLRGEQIPLAARIFAVVDVWDALHSNRAYRLAWEDARVRKYIHEQAGKHFDPQVVDAFFETLSENIPELGTDDSHPTQPTNPPAR